MSALCVDTNTHCVSQHRLLAAETNDPRPLVVDDNKGVLSHYMTTEGLLWLCPVVPPRWDRPMEQRDSGVTEGEKMVAEYWLGRCCSQVAGVTSACILLSRASLLSTPEFPGQGHLREKSAAARHMACGRFPWRFSIPTLSATLPAQHHLLPRFHGSLV